MPHDAGTTYQPGARLAPFHVRRVSALVQDTDVFARLRCVDGGNIVFPPFDRAAMREAVQGHIARLAAQRVRPLVIGGDHSITLPILRALATQHGPLAIVHFDAHLDTSGPDVWGDAFHHGTPMRHALDEALVAPGQLFHLGVRGPRGATDPKAVAFTADQIAERGAARVCAELRERIGTRPTYVSFDVDALDPAFAPGTGTPVPGGLTSREALGLVRGLAGIPIVGGDIVEVCPPLDHADLTSHLAAHLGWELLGAMPGRDRPT